MEETTKPQAKRRRARKTDGQFDNGYEATPIESALPKQENKYAVKQQVTGASGDAGKYQKKPKVRPTFGNTHTTYN